MLTQFFDLVLLDSFGKELKPVSSNQIVFDGNVIGESWIYRTPGDESIRKKILQGVEEIIQLMMKQANVKLPNCPKQRTVMMNKDFIWISYMY